MAGHSQFKNIMHRKGAQDAKRAKIFTKIGREIQVSVKTSGADITSNSRLRAAIAMARENNMPNERIKKSIDAGLGIGNTADYFEMRYEGYGPSGVAIIVEALTDNKNRTAGDVRSTFAKYGGNLGETGSVNFMFDRIGQIIYPASKLGTDEMFELAVELGVDNVESSMSDHEIICSPDHFAEVKEKFESKLGPPEKSGLTWKPNVMAPVESEAATVILKLIDALEDNDDVQSVITNFEVSEETMRKLVNVG